MDKPHKKVLAPLAPSLVVLDKDSGRLAATDNERIYVTDVAGKLHCLDTRTGECYWVHETGDQAWGGPLVADGKLYFGNKKNFYIMTTYSQRSPDCQIRSCSLHSLLSRFLSTFLPSRLII